MYNIVLYRESKVNRYFILPESQVLRREMCIFHGQLSHKFALGLPSALLGAARIEGGLALVL